MDMYMPSDRWRRVVAMRSEADSGCGEGSIWRGVWACPLTGSPADEASTAEAESFSSLSLVWFCGASAWQVVLQKTTNKQLLTTVLLAAVISAAVKDQLEGLRPKFIIEQTLNHGLVEVPMFILVGAACGVMAVALEKMMVRPTPT